MLLMKCIWITLLLLHHSHAEGELIFRPLMHQPRIYQEAPPGVHVTTVHAYDPESPRNKVVYALPDVLDNNHFVLDQVSGNLTTAKIIKKDIGEFYQVMVSATSAELSELEHLQIIVTEFNQFAPRFEKQLYRAELSLQAPVDTEVLQVHAVDPDPVPQNAEVYYKMDQNQSTHFFDLNPETGKLTVARSINTTRSSLVFGIFAEDGGSPKRWAHVQIEINIKTISAPLDIVVSDVTTSSAIVCWMPPEFGFVTGYLFTYRLAGQRKYDTKDVNAGHTRTCATLNNLVDGAKYEFNIEALNPEETGLQSPWQSFKTEVNRCLESVCKRGDCVFSEKNPWYSCVCPRGYYGQHCEFFNKCSLNPCLNSGTCQNTTNNEYICICIDGYVGENCSTYNPCLLKNSLCQNGGTCEIADDDTYHCICPDDFYGPQCSRRNSCSRQPCLNGGTCISSNDNSFSCMCPIGFKGQLCEEEIDECASNPCRNGSTCLGSRGSFSCICPPGYTSRTCDTPIQCLQDETHTNQGIFHWSKTNHSTVISVHCPFGEKFLNAEEKYAERSCLLLENGTVTWGKINSIACRDQELMNAEELTVKLHNLTRDRSAIYAASTGKTTAGINTIATLAARDKELAQEMVTVISNALKPNNSVIEEDENGTLSENILQVVDDLVSNVPLKRGETRYLKTENIQIQAVSWHPDIAANTSEEFGDLVFEVPPPKIVTSAPFIPMHNTSTTPMSNSDMDVAHSEPKSKKENEEEKTEEIAAVMHVCVPREALEEAHRQLQQDVRVKFVVYSNDKLFQPKKESSDLSEEKKSTLGTNTSTNSAEEIEYDIPPKAPVLQISVGNVNLKNMSKPLIYIFPMTTKRKAVCVFWKEKERLWATDGLTTNQTDKFVICESNHMTAFSVLLDPTPEMELSENHKNALSLISYIGCALSVLGLSLTLLTYSLFRSLNRDRQGKILLNLCASLLMLNLTFLLGALKSPEGGNLCAAIAILLHYFVLTSLSWMCVEAINMYQLLIYVFATAENHFMMKRCILAWGLPMIIVIISATIHFQEYISPNSVCMLSPNNPWIYYGAFFTPCCLILLANAVVFFMVSRVLFAPRFTSKTTEEFHPPQQVTAAQIRGAFTVLILLGITWVFGTFAVKEAKLTFQYIFCVLNSLQGFLIFLARCFLYPEARSAWVQLIKYRKFKKHRGVLPPSAGSWSTNSQSTSKPKTPKTLSITNKTSNGEVDSVVLQENFWNRSNSRERQNGKAFRLDTMTNVSMKNQLKPSPVIADWSYPDFSNFKSTANGDKKENASPIPKLSPKLNLPSDIVINEKNNSCSSKVILPRDSVLAKHGKCNGKNFSLSKPNENRSQRNKIKRHEIIDSPNEFRNTSFYVSPHFSPMNSVKFCDNQPPFAAGGVKSFFRPQRHRPKKEIPQEIRSISLVTCINEGSLRQHDIQQGQRDVNNLTPRAAGIRRSSATRFKCRPTVVVEKDDDGQSDTSNSTDIEDSPCESPESVQQRHNCVVTSSNKTKSLKLPNLIRNNKSCPCQKEKF